MYSSIYDIPEPTNLHSIDKKIMIANKIKSYLDYDVLPSKIISSNAKYKWKFPNHIKTFD